VAEVDYFMSLVAFVDIVIPILLIILITRAMVILRRRSDQLDSLERRIKELENQSRQGSGS
jgi:hypothetical protein